MEYRHCGDAKEASTSRSVAGVTEASCAILSVRIEFRKSRRERQCDDDDDHDDVDVDCGSTPPATTRQVNSDDCSDRGGERRRQLQYRDRTSTTMRHAAKTTYKPTSPSRAVSVAGRGRVVVIDDGVYDQFARRHPPKYLTNRTFNAMLNRRVFNKW